MGDNERLLNNRDTYAVVSTDVPCILQSVQPSQTEIAKSVAIYKVAKTGILVSLWLEMGIIAGIMGPSMDAYLLLVNCNYEEVARALIGKMVGIICGGIVGGALADKFKSWIDLLLCVEVLMLVGGFAALPWVSTLYLMALSLWFSGFGHGAISAGGNAYCLSLWGVKATVPLHIIHCGYTVGSTVAPLVLIPFISTNSTHNGTLMRAESSGMDLGVGGGIAMTYNYSSSSAQNHTIGHSELAIPYTIIAAYGALLALVFFIFVCIPVPNGAQVSDGQSSSSFRQIWSCGACFGPNEAAYGGVMLTLLIIFYMGLVGRDVSAGGYLYPIAVDTKLHFTPANGARLFVAVSGAQALGRIVSVFVAMVVRIQVLVFLEVFGIFVCQICLVLWGLDSPLSLWILAPAMFFFTGPTFPSGMAWADKYMVVTASVVAVVDIATGLGGLMATWLAGYLFQYYTPMSVLILSLAFGLVNFLVLVVVQIVASRHGERVRPSEELAEGGDVDHLIQ